MWHPKCELSELKIRSNNGPILAAKSRPMLLDQHQRSNRPSVVPVLAEYIGILNLPCFCRSLAQQWLIKGPKVGIILANQVGSQKDRIRPSNGPIWKAESQYYSDKPCYRIRSRKTRVCPSNGTLLDRKSALFCQTRLDVKQPECGLIN